MTEPVRTIKLNTPAAAWFPSRSASTGAPAAADRPGPGASPPSPVSDAVPAAVWSSDLGRRVSEAVLSSPTPGDLLKQLVLLMTRETDCLGLWIAPRSLNASDELRFQALLDRQEADWLSLLSGDLQRLARQAKVEGLAYLQEGPVGQRRQLAVVPVWGGDQSEEILAGCFSVDSRHPTRGLDLLLLAAQAMTHWRKRRAFEASQGVNLSLHQISQAVCTVAKAPTRTGAAIALVNQILPILGGQHAVLASGLRSGAVSIEAISDLEKFETRNEHIEQLKQIFRVTAESDRVWVYPSESNECPAAMSAALAEYSKLAGTPAAAWLPLCDDGVPKSGLLIGLSQLPAEPRSFRELGGFLANQIGATYRLAVRADRPWYRACLDAIRNVYRPMGGRTAAVVAALLSVALLFPIPHQIPCNSELQPVIRRYVAAPFEGVLEEVNVRCGDKVEGDQLLARMDGTALQMELSGYQAQLAAAQKRRDSALAGGNVADSQIARNEMKRVESQIELTNAKLRRLEVRSPIAGVIVSGDMDKVQGARLEMGQSLFEVAPLESLAVEVRVPENDARHVQPGQQVQLKFSAFPFRNWQGTVQRLHPRSEFVDDVNVFVAEVELANEDGTLRPGMQGHARIAAGWKPLAWVWLHHAWERMRYGFVW